MTKIYSPALRINKMRKEKQFTCKYCNQVFMRVPLFLDKDPKFCSKRCYGNSLIGKQRPPEIGKRLSLMKLGKKNTNWKGEGAGYTSLHAWVKRYLPKSSSCKDCGVITSKLDLANISQLYKRDLLDWEWLCRKCHMTKDGRLDALHENFKKWINKSLVKNKIKKNDN